MGPLQLISSFDPQQISYFPYPYAIELEHSVGILHRNKFDVQGKSSASLRTRITECQICFSNKPASSVSDLCR